MLFSKTLLSITTSPLPRLGELHLSEGARYASGGATPTAPGVPTVSSTYCATCGDGDTNTIAIATLVGALVLVTLAVL